MTLTRAECRRLELLGRIIQLPQASSSTLLPDDASSDARRDLSADVRALRDAGLVALDERLYGGWIASSTVEGRDARAEFIAQQNDVAARQSQLRNDFLRWLYEKTRAGQFTVSARFLDAGHDFLGLPFTPAELGQAGSWLKRRGFIEGAGGDGRPHPLRARPTAKGEDYVEMGRDVHECEPVASTTTITAGGDVQLAQNSSHVVQVHARIGAEAAAGELATMLEQLVRAVDAKDGDQLAEFAEQLRDEARGEARPRRLREIGAALTKAFSGGLGGALGAGLVGYVTTWMSTLG